MDRKILVVEDDSAINEVIDIILQDYGYAVTTLTNGDLIHSSIEKDKPSLILLDYFLPGKDGKTIIQELRRNKRTESIPIIVISASLEAQTLTREAGATGFLSKPFTIEELIASVENHSGAGWPEKPHDMGNKNEHAYNN